MAESPTSYPVRLTIDYSEKERDRLTTLFRLILAIPICIVLALLLDASGAEEDQRRYEWAAVGFIVAPTLLMILFRQKYPRWWFDWNVALVKFATRVSAYVLLLRDEYPSTDEEQAVHIDITYPNVKEDLNRWLPLVKWLLAIPHVVVLCILTVPLVAVAVVAWFAILFTGRYPKDLFDFVVGILRWDLRVFAYALLLTTDCYPPFRLTD